MLDGEGAEDKILIFHQDAGFDVEQLDLDAGVRAAQDDPEEQVVDAIQRRFAAPNLKMLGGIPASKSRDKPAQTQDVVKVAVGQQDLIEAAEAKTTPQNLTLG